MSDFYKYPIRTNHKVYLNRIPELDHFESIRLPPVACFDHCIIRITLKALGEDCFVYVSIQLGGVELEKRRIRARCYVEIVNKKEENSKIFKKERTIGTGKFCHLSDWVVYKIFGKKRGWVNNGELEFKFGVYAYAIEVQNVWYFNLHDKLFNQEEIRQSIVMPKTDSREILISNKQLLVFHSSTFAKCQPNMDSRLLLPPECDMNFISTCIQMAHGVQIHCKASDLLNLIQSARPMRLRNVQIYCERLLIQQYSHLKMRPFNILFAFRNKIHRYLYLNLQKLESFEQFKEILKEADMQMMSTESMKICMKVFMENEEWE